MSEPELRTLTIPDGTRLTFHPAVEAAERAVHRTLMRWPITGEEARNWIRVEITHDVEMELRARVSVSNLYLAHDPNQVGPMKIMGVSYYVVQTLPEPGWRVLP